MGTYNQNINENMNELDILRLFSLSEEFKLIPKDVIQKFTSDELELLINGRPYIDVEEWRMFTDYKEPYNNKGECNNCGETINYINSLPVNVIKLQLLHILRDTDLAEYYLDKSNNFHLLSLEEYAYILGECVNHLRPDIVVHRLTGDGPKKDLIAPLWSADKKRVLNYINKYFKDNNIVQGRKYSNGS